MRVSSLVVCGLLLGAMAVAGCNRRQAEFQPYEEAEKPPAHDHHHHHHGTGPHGGRLIDLGNHEYLAEVVFDEQAKAITVFLTDHDTGDPLAVEQPEITLMLEVDGRMQPFTLTAAPLEADPEGRSSRFELAGDPTIAEHVRHEEDLEGELRVTIDGRELTGYIDHHHDHDHDHDH